MVQNPAKHLIYGAKMDQPELLLGLASILKSMTDRCVSLKMY